MFAGREKELNFQYKRELLFLSKQYKELQKDAFEKTRTIMKLSGIAVY
jgi:hypothetical protein